MVCTHLQPLRLMLGKLLWGELATARMLVIVTMDLRMTVETDRDCIRDTVVSSFGCRPDMVCLDLHAAEAVTDAASSVACYEKRSNFGTVERHDLPLIPLLPNVGPQRPRPNRTLSGLVRTASGPGYAGGHG